MSAPGWIPAHRKLFEREDWLAPSTRDPANNAYAWLWLCQKAQHEDYEHAGERLKRGEVLVSVRHFAKRMGWSKSRASRFIGRLISGTMIGTVRGTPNGTVYRITTYDTYAVVGNGQRDTSRDTERDASGTLAGQEQPLTINHQQNTNGQGELLTDPSTPTLIAVNRFLDTLKLTWKLKGSSLREWCHELDSDSRYVPLDIPDQIRRCEEWHDNKGSRPKSPTGAIGTWLRNAVGQYAEKSQPVREPGDRFYR